MDQETGRPEPRIRCRACCLREAHPRGQGPVHGAYLNTSMRALGVGFTVYGHLRARIELVAVPKTRDARNFR